MRFRQLLVVDGSRGGERVLADAGDVAVASGGHVRLVAPPVRRGAWEADADRGASLRRLEGQAGLLRERGLHVTTGVLAGDGAEAILREATRAGSELVLKRRADPGPLAGVLRADADRQLVRRAPCPVWLVDEEGPADGPILAVLGGDVTDADAPATALDDRVLEAAAALAAALRTALHVVYAWSAPLMPALGRISIDPRRNRRTIEEGAAAASARAERCLAAAALHLPRGRIHLVRAAPDAALPWLAARLRGRLVVLGDVPRRGLAALTRGVAERVLRPLPCSLLVVRAEARRAPARPRAATSPGVLRPADG